MNDFKILSLGVPVKLSADQSDYLCKELEAKDKRIAELEKALDKLIDQASMCDSWECFPSDWLDEAYESLSKAVQNEP